MRGKQFGNAAVSLEKYKLKKKCRVVAVSLRILLYVIKIPHSAAPCFVGLLQRYSSWAVFWRGSFDFKIHLVYLCFT